jgi:hypothetical protein
MKGVIEKLWEREDRTGRRYLLLEIGGQRYSLWDEDLMDGLGEGVPVDYQWKQAGKYKNLTSVKRDGRYRSSAGQERRDLDMVRMSCLKSAASLLVSSDLSPDEKGDVTLDLAKQFEKYILRDEQK